MRIIEPEIDRLVTGLGFPEGPLATHDAIYVCDIHGGAVRKIQNGRHTMFANPGGGPNGLAIGADGGIYVANNGGAMRWVRDGSLLLSDGFKTDGFDARIERIDPHSGTVERILDNIDGHLFQAIDDLVFGSDGSFWFTDLGRDGRHSRSYGGIYWSSPDGRHRKEVVYPLINGANGIGLSPDGKALYATEYGSGRLWTWTVEAPGVLRKDSDQSHGGKLLWQSGDAQLLDSLALTACGNIIVATQPSGVFSVISPDGTHLMTVRMPDHFPTNLCFDPRDPNVAYATLSSTGCLAKLVWPEAGLPTLFS